ncbi:unnamed protein product [Cuscuta europaea]|uniref:Uncharacterized protein n=1 Tax=Cuscuta europaea TaxID=41803 RepID=A0A9P0Z8V0_CUSEU|nr:unnamed protein product [Cuscuta europaea]
MLQWMGGSRRKVVTSRNSTLKRQKQYFEQRKLKHRHSQADLGKYYGSSPYNQQHENSTSLDVLSLLNLSAVSGEPISGNIEGVTPSPNYQTRLCPQTAQANEVTQISPLRIKPEGVASTIESPACDLADTVCPRNFPVGAPESQGKKLKGDWNTLNQSMMSTENPLSVIDILGDDCPNRNLEENVGHEAHVAFSIQGLGKVDTETPVHSPERPGRNFSYGQYLPLKERMKTLSSVKTTSRPDLKHKLDAVMRDIGTSIYRSPVEPSVRSMVSDDLFGSPRQDLLSNKKSSPVTNYYTSFEENLEAGELFGKERRKNIQNATSSGLPYGISDQEDYGLPCKNELDQMEFCSSSQNEGRSYDHQDFTFDETRQWKKRLPFFIFQVADATVL